MQREIDQKRFKALYDLSKMHNEPRQAILDFALEASVKITSSSIGYIYLASEDEEELSLHAWSKNVMPECNVDSYPDAYKVCETGLWGEAVRQRKPIITNNYSKSSYKKGFPKGHIEVKNHMNIPVFDNDRIVIVAGVGNKDGDYTDEDVQQLTLMMDAMWNILKRKEIEDELIKTNENLEKIIEERTVELEKANEELYRIIAKQQLIEVELKKNEKLFRGVFDNAAVGIMLLSKDGYVKLTNQISADLLGYTLEELRSKQIIDFVHPDFVEPTLSKIRKNVRDGVDRWSSERKLIKKDGDSIWFHTNTAVLRDSDGNVESLIIVGIDITARVQAEETVKRNSLELERRRAQLRLIIDSVPALISYINNDLKYKFVNARYRTLFRLEAEDFVGKHISQIIGTLAFDSVKEHYDSALKGDVQTFEIELNLFDKNHIFDVTIIPHYFEDVVEGMFILAVDVTERKNVENELKTYSDRFELASLAGNIGVWEWDPITNELIWDKRMFELYNISEEEFSQTHEAWQKKVHPDDLKEAEKALRMASEPGGQFNCEFRIVWPDGQIKTIKASAFTQFNGQSKSIKMTGVNWDITKQKEMEDNLKKLSITDPLTGATNRRFFMDKAHSELERYDRYGSPLSLLMIDIDRFKTINDRFGHDAGDEVLIRCVKKCLSVLRNSDIFSRIGGEEFAVLLINTEIDDALKMAERLRTEIEQLEVRYLDNKISFTISVGLSELIENDTLETILKRSDSALYNAKEMGRNRVEKA